MRSSRITLAFLVFLVVLLSLLLLQLLLRQAPVVILEKKVFVSNVTGDITIPFRSVLSKQGLGNNIFEYVALIGIARQLNRRPVVNLLHDKVLTSVRKLSQSFVGLVDNLHFRIIEETTALRSIVFHTASAVYDDVTKLNDYKDQLLLLDGGYFQSHKYFHHMREEVRQMLTPTKSVFEEATNITGEHIHPNDRIVCIHVRRGDYILHHKAEYTATSAEITKAVVDHFGRKLTEDNITFVFLSDDRKWTMKLFTTTTNVAKNRTSWTYDHADGRKSQLFFPDTSKHPVVDWAISRLHCDHVVITAPASTFGFWLGYLAKEGAKIYYSLNVSPPGGHIRHYKFSDFFPPDWTGFSLKNDNRTIVEAQ